MSTPGLSTRAALKSAKKATLTKVLREVLDLDENDLLMKAVESQGVRGIDNLLALSATDVDTMVHNKDDGTREAVPKVQKNLLKIQIVFFRLSSSGTGLRPTLYKPPRALETYQDPQFL